MIRRLAALLILLGVPAPLEAQGARIGGPSMISLFQVEPIELDWTRPSIWSGTADYAVEGGIAGAAVLGLLGLTFAASACDSDNTNDSCLYTIVGTTLVTGLVGGVIGLFVGSAIEKSASEPR